MSILPKVGLDADFIATYCWQNRPRTKNYFAVNVNDKIDCLIIRYRYAMPLMTTAFDLITSSLLTRPEVLNLWVITEAIFLCPIKSKNMTLYFETYDFI